MIHKFIITTFIVFSLAACDSGKSNQAIVPKPPSVTPNNPQSVNVPDNSASTDYQVIIYGNSHSRALGGLLETLVTKQLTNKSITTTYVGGSFLDEIVAKNGNLNKLSEDTWTHAIFQGQKYSQSGTVDYPVDAAIALISRAKANGITPVLFPEHPQQGQLSEGRRVYDLHLSISNKEPSCVAPVGLVWDRLLEVLPNAPLYTSDGNHASYAGNVLTAMTFYEVITAEVADLMMYDPAIALSQQDQALYAQIVSEVLALYPACPVT